MAVPAALGVLATFAVYRPDRDLPFDFLDFSEFLSLLKRGGSFFDRLSELIPYYAAQGRFNLIGYATLAARWELWGDSSPGWQWTRFATMWVIIILAYRLLRRIGVSPLGAVTGCSVFLFAPPAFDGWTRLTMAEPLGLVLLLAACLLALRPANGPPTERRIGVAFAAICVSIVLLKEMLVATLLLPLFLVYAESGLSSSPVPRRRLRTLLLAMIVSVPIASIPVLLIAARASHGAYTTAFGSQINPISDALAHWSLGIFPFDPGTSFPGRLTGLALLAFVAILVTGWAVRIRMADVKLGLRSRRLLALTLLFPLVGALTYLPWPAWNRFYSLPFLVAGAILASVAFTAIEGWSRRAFVGTCLVWGLFLGAAATGASAEANRLAARQLVNRAVVTRLAQLHDSYDTVFVATDQVVPEAWQGLGPTLERYGRAFGLDMPAVVNMPCRESQARSSSGRAALVAYKSHCPGFTTTNPIVVRYRRLRISAVPLTTDSLRVDFIQPTLPPGADRVP